VAAACTAWLLGAAAGGACGAAIVDLDVGEDGRADDGAEDAPPPADDAPAADDGCGTLWYHDGDGDTYGDPLDAYCGASCPAGYVDNDDDCCDSKAGAHPGQTAYFDASFSCDGGTASFDYDCNGHEDPERTATDGSCSGTLPPCTLREGWQGSSVPACGVTAGWVQGCGVGCLPDVVNRPQACH
jgi:hypothetical protein